VPQIDLEPAARAVAQLLEGVSDEQLTAPTPCADTPVAALLDHLMGLSLAFTWAARKSTPPELAGNPPAPAAAEHLEPEWRSALPRRLDDLVAAWRDPAAWEGMTEAGGLTMPAAEAAKVALDEVVLHGWDLARATGQPYRPDEASTAVVLDFVTQVARPELAAMRQGLFGPVVEVPAGAPAFERALGLAGRDPAWTPTSAGSAPAPVPAGQPAPVDPGDVVRRLWDSYRAEDRAAAEALIGPDFVFTSPQDDHIDRATYFEKCFPTASHMRRQEIKHLVVTGDDVFMMYEYELQNGEVYRNTELLTVRHGQVVDAQVFFGGRYDT
jgi:uncharacterized protein (TIGR03086 family)